MANPFHDARGRFASGSSGKKARKIPKVGKRVNNPKSGAYSANTRNELKRITSYKKALGGQKFSVTRVSKRG